MTKKVKCECGWEDTYEPDEFGINYYQAIGKCPCCNEDLGTAIKVEFKAIERSEAK